jgi:hypothetical protein
MDKVQEFLQSVMQCLENIEDRMGEGQKSKDKFIAKKTEIAARKLVEKAQEMIDASDKYLSLIETKADALTGLSYWVLLLGR